jgi:predicted amidohydrolase YtcJ
MQPDPRFSIIHCQITDEALLKKYTELNVIAHIQPIFIQSDLHMVDSRIGTERAKTSYCWKTLHETGVHVAHGSDCPVEKFDVLPGIYCAVTRKDQTGYPENGWYSDQCLSVYDAVKGFTLGAAYASFEEDKKGSITEGKFADLIVLNQNIFEIDKNLIKDTKVDMTILNGEIKYERSCMI